MVELPTELLPPIEQPLAVTRERRECSIRYKAADCPAKWLIKKFILSNFVTANFDFDTMNRLQKKFFVCVPTGMFYLDAVM